MRPNVWLILWVLVVVTLLACSPTPAPLPTPSQPTTIETPAQATPASPPVVTPTPVPPTPVPETLPATPSVQSYTYQVVHSYPHDPAAFTEGLVYDNSFLYESTGLEGKSSLRQVQLETGKVLLKTDLSPLYFGEGIAVVGDKIIQLTWQSHTGFVYDKNTFQALDTFNYSTEGWGLAYDGKQLIMSDGTPILYFIDPNTLTVTGTLIVNDAGTPVPMLNELEYINGSIYANVWTKDTIVIIDPRTGRVTGKIDLTGLIQSMKPSGRVDVLNGIAYDAANDKLFVTGKFWPRLFEIRLTKQ